MDFITIRNLIKVYKMGVEKVTALNGISLDIKKGEVVAVMGPSGSGKSTLMHILGGLDKPTSGSVQVNDIDLEKLNSRQLANYRNKQIGFIFQSFNLKSDLTALENVELPLIFSSSRIKKRKHKALDALKKVGLADRVKHKPTELSGGQRQRVSIARALVNNPGIILADEPTGNLDSKNGKLILELLKNISREEGTTLIIVTHDVNVAAEADRIINVRDGEII